MASNKPLSDTEKDFVAATWPTLPVAEIARRLGRGRTCINNYIRSSGLRERAGDAPRANAPDEREPSAGRQDTLERLRELRELLRSSLVEAPTAMVASLSREYRATVDEIARLEEQDGGDGDDVLDRLADALVRRTGQAQT